MFDDPWKFFSQGDTFVGKPGDPFAEYRKHQKPLSEGGVPMAVKCGTERDLADWFMEFARACRTNLPAVQ